MIVCKKSIRGADTWQENNVFGLVRRVSCHGVVAPAWDRAPVILNHPAAKSGGRVGIMLVRDFVRRAVRPICVTPCGRKTLRNGGTTRHTVSVSGRLRRPAHNCLYSSDRARRRDGMCDRETTRTEP